jgi:glucan phosphoethanolaminetransferase (alkaline phosphatase superfamily)
VKVLVLLSFCWVVADRSQLYPDIQNKVMGTAITMLLLVFVGSLGQRIHVVFVAGLVLLIGAHFLTLSLYGPISYDLVLALRYTTLDESLGYARDLFKPVMAIPWVLGAGLVLYALVRSRLVVPNRFVVVSFGLLLLAIPAVRSFKAGLDWSDRYKDKSIAFSSVPGKLLATTVHQFSVVNELADWSESFEADHDWSAFRDLKPKRLNVIVIGESGRSDFYDLNGFNLFPLTPNIDTTFSYNFSQCFAPASTTISSLMRTLFLTDPMGGPLPQANIVALFKHHGARTFWVSNQGRVGRNDSPIASLGLTCDSSYFLNKTSYHSASAGDRAMLPWLEGVIRKARSDPRPTLILVHMLAQHPPLDRTYDAWDLPFRGPGMVAKYMRSTRDTDLFLGELYALVRETDDHNMFYFSDHGLGYDERRDHFIHTDRFRENYHVPFVIWSGQDRPGRSIAQPVALTNLLGLLHAFNRAVPLQLDSLVGSLPPPIHVFDSKNLPKPISGLEVDTMDLTYER